MGEILMNNKHHIELSAISRGAGCDTVPKYSSARRGAVRAHTAGRAGPSMASRALTRRVEKARERARAHGDLEVFSARSRERTPDAPSGGRRPEGRKAPASSGARGTCVGFQRRFGSSVHTKRRFGYLLREARALLPRGDGGVAMKRFLYGVLTVGVIASA